MIESMKPASTSSRNLIILYSASFLVQLGTAMTISYVPIYAQDLGAALTVVGLIATLRSLGGMLINFPGGFLAERYSVFRIFIGCFIAMVSAAVLRALAPSLISLLIAGLLLGSGKSMWILGRLTYIRKSVAGQVRGRVLAGFSGIMRATRVIGPLIGSAIIAGVGFSRLFFTEALLLLSGMLLLLFFFRLPQLHRAQGARESLKAVKTHYAQNRVNITAAMTGMFGLTVIRAARVILIPLWASHIGLTISQLGLILSVSALVEIALVVPAGFSVDKLGRKATLLMTIFLTAAGMLLITFTHTFSTMLAASLLIGLGNGLGSGINMIFSTDLAPDSSVGLFIGIWRIVTESGAAAGPFLVGVIADSFTLSKAPPVISLIGFLSGVVLLLFFKGGYIHTADLP